MTAPRRLPIRARLALFSTGVLLCIVAGLGVAVVAELRSGLRDRAHESLEAPFRVVAGALERPDAPTLRTVLRAAPPRGEGRDEIVGQILDARGRVLERTGEPATLRPMVGAGVLAAAARDGQWHEPRHLPGRTHDDIVLVVPLRGARAGSFAVLAQTLAPEDTTVAHLVRLLLVLAPLVLLLALAGGWRIAAAGLRPVDVLTRTAAGIDPGHSDAALPVPAREDELARLARTLNAMLDRLRRALDAERRFAGDASHELRTPLALMAAEVDVALRSPQTPPAARPILESVREEVRRLARTVDDLLLLARADATGEVTLAREDADLLDVAVDVVAHRRAAAAERGVAVAVAGEPAIASLDVGLMTQAVANLVDNAIDYSPRGARVTVTVSDGAAPRVEVADEGPGIAAEDLPHVFDRFYRTDRARDRRTGGSGLGLAITRSIVDAHAGRIDVASAPGEGSRFAIVLAREAGPPPPLSR